MKRITTIFVALMLCFMARAQEALITGYVDSPCPGADGRTVEIYVSGTVDFTDWNIVKQSNGGGFTANTDISGLGTITDGFAYITNDETTLDNEFGINSSNSTIIESGSISDNGDDGFQLTNADGDVIDRFSEDGVDGTGTNWEHEDSYYYRNNGQTANAGNFDPANWTFGDLNALDDEGTCNGGDPLNDIVPFGSYEMETSNNAQVPIGPQDGTTSKYPIYSCYNYSYTQQLVYQSEINAAGDITSISFYYAEDDYDNSTDWTIYLGQTSKTEFESSSDWISADNLTEVYSGIVSFPEEGNLMTITFDTPFSYDNTENLVVAVDENQPDHNCSVEFGKTADLGVTRAIYYRNDNTNPDPTSPPTAPAFSGGTSDFINYMILGGIQQSCAYPSDLTAEGTGATTADLSWTPGGDENEWEVKYGEFGFDPENEGTSELVSGSPELSLSDLNFGTTYEFYVKADCGNDEESNFFYSESFTTDCVTITSFPYTEGFENFNTPDLPNCWTQNDANSDDDVWETYENYGVDGSQAAGLHTDFNNGDNDDYLISPQITLTGNERLKFSVRARSSSEPDDFNVVLSATDTAAASFTEELLPVTTVSSEDYQEYTIDLDAYTGDVYIAIHIPPSDTDGYYIYVDNFIVETIPSCLKPTDLAVDNITMDGASIYWNAGADETDWEVVVDTADFDPDEGTSQTVTDTTTTLTGLEANTAYDVYVRADCGESDTSEWEGPITFMTNCDATDIPFTQDFEGVEPPVLPNCGSIETNVGAYNDDGWYTSHVTSYGFSSNVLRHDYSSSGSPDLDDWYFTQGINLEADVDYQITFQYGSNSTLEEKLKVAFGTSPESSAMTDPSNEITDLTFEMNGSDNAEETFQVPVSGVYYFGFQIHSGDNKYYLYVDDIHIDVAPTCFHPTEFSVDNETAEGADVYWMAGGDEDQWEVVVDTVDFDPDEGSPLTVTDTTTTLTGLDSETDYEVYVRADCGEGDTSEWEGPISFTTLPTCPAPTDLSVDDTGENTADISWTAGGDETEWEVVYGEAGFEPDNGGAADSPITVTSDPNTQITGLDSATAYDFYVRAICSDSDESSLTGPISFYTDIGGGYCLPTFSSGCNLSDEIDDFTLVGENDTSIEDEGTGCSDGAFNDRTDESVDLAAGSDYTATVLTGATSDHLAIWIDFNDDGTFDDPGERVATFQDLSITAPGSNATLSIPSGSELGTHRMRVMVAFVFLGSPDDLDPCNDADHSYGEVHDYSVNIIEGTTSCPMPVDVTIDADNITATTADVSWTSNGSETQWEVLYGEAGFNPGDAGQSVTVNDDPQTTLSDLDPDTDYDVYVRAVCGEDNVSDWTGPESFTTEMAPCEMPTDISINADDITDSSADVSWTSNGDETQWEVLYGETGFNPGEAGQSVTVNDDPQTTLSDLDPDTAYDVYVRAVCGEDNVSDWTGPESFMTEMEPCEAPTDITFSNNDNLSIDVSWTPVDSETQWEVLYGEAGFNPGDAGQSVTVNDDPQTTLEDLDPDTAYDVYVRAVCGEDNVSDWAGPANFLDVNRQVFESFTYYPNPVKGQLTLKANAPIESVTVFNLLGQEVISVNPNTLEAQVNTEDLQAAVYLMKVNINGSSKTFRIVKE